jgi:transcriptional regulator with XRE-family HTH domain
LKYHKLCYILAMNGAELKTARLASSWTQKDAARKLGVTQAYLSMVERGTRPVSTELGLRAIDVFALPATALPLGNRQPRARDEFSFKQALGALGYPGFAYLGESARVNPAELLMDALDTDDLDARVTEALPWLPLAYPELNWDWLTFHAKVRGRQNRLAFIVDLARQLAEKKRDANLSLALAERVNALEGSRLAAEDTLCEASMTRAERKWLKTHRSKAAEHWNLLADLTVEHLDHAHA